MDLNHSLNHNIEYAFEDVRDRWDKENGFFTLKLIVPVLFFVYYLRTIYYGKFVIFSKFIHFHVIMYISLISTIFNQVCFWLENYKIFVALSFFFQEFTFQILITVVLLQAMFLFTKLPDQVLICGCFKTSRNGFITFCTVIAFIFQLFFAYFALSMVTIGGRKMVLYNTELFLQYLLFLTLLVWILYQGATDRNFLISGDKIPYFINSSLFLVVSMSCLIVRTIYQLLTEPTGKVIVVHNITAGQFLLPYLWIVSANLVMKPKVLTFFKLPDRTVEEIDMA